MSKNSWLHSLALSSVADDGFPLLHYGMIRGDNFGYFVQVNAQSVLAIDVPDGKKMLSTLNEQGWKLEALLLTHTHHDHMVDLPLLLEETGCRFFHAKNATGIPQGTGLVDGQGLNLLGLKVEAMETSGHSPLDLSFYFPELDLCFCGDTLFAWGCGRMFAGPATRLWESIKRIRDLPDQTQLCCGHDYAEDNLRFYEMTFPNLPPLRPLQDVLHMPLSLKSQKMENPFLRADDPEIASALGYDGKQAWEVFKVLRELRNQL